MNSADLEQLWEDGIPLADAWFLMGEEELRDQYRDAGSNQHLTASLRKMMRGDVLTSLLHGIWRAVGYRTKPDLSDGPELIDRAVFARSENVNWDESAARGIGREYQEIRVCQPEQPSQPENNSDAPPSPPRTEQQTNPKMGRPSAIPKLIEIISDLDRRGEFQGKMQKEKDGLVGDEARRRYPEVFVRETHPAKSTIVQAFKKYRDEGSD